MNKFCIVCGSENFSRSKNFCCEKCHQKYYYEKNKEKLLQKHNEYYEQNKDTMNENAKKWYKNNVQKHKENSKKWIENNRERYNELVRMSYTRRKEATK